MADSERSGHTHVDYLSIADAVDLGSQRVSYGGPDLLARLGGELYGQVAAHLVPMTPKWSPGRGPMRSPCYSGRAAGPGDRGAAAGLPAQRPAVGVRGAVAPL